MLSFRNQIRGSITTGLSAELLTGNYRVVEWRLLSDAEPAENVAKDFVGSDLPGDLAEVVKGFADIGGKQVGGEV
jgi:hypothetical protein